MFYRITGEKQLRVLQRDIIGEAQVRWCLYVNWLDNLSNPKGATVRHNSVTMSSALGLWTSCRVDLLQCIQDLKPNKLYVPGYAHGYSSQWSRIFTELYFQGFSERLLLVCEIVLTNIQGMWAEIKRIFKECGPQTREYSKNVSKK